MNREAVISRINDDVPFEPLKGACIRLVDYVYNHDNLAHLSFTKLAKIVDSEDSVLILQMTQYLAGAGVQLLDMRFELIIGEDTFELDAEYLEEAQRTSKLIHPEDGVEVLDFERKVYPYFVPTQAVIEGKGND